MSDHPHRQRLSDAILITLSFVIVLGLLAFLFLDGNIRRSLPALPALPFISRQPAVPAPAQTACSGARCPAAILDLAAWKLTLPVQSEQNKKTPLEIRQPALAAYSLTPWFVPTPDGKGVAFRAPVNAPTTSSSDYPRSELREMAPDGKKEALWPSTEGIHTLFLDQAITAVPKTKPDVVAGQIHGDDDDLLTVRLEYPTLSLTRSKQDVATLDANYTLGKRFTIKFVVRDGRIMTYYNGSATPVYTLEKRLKQAYFKAGVYTQSNCDTEGQDSLCAADNYGEVVIYRSVITHE